MKSSLNSLLFVQNSNKWKTISFIFILLVMASIVVSVVSLLFIAKKSVSLTGNVVSENKEGVGSFAKELVKEDYYTLKDFDTNGKAKITIKNPDTKELTFEELRNKTTDKDKSPLDFNVNVLEGGYESINAFVLENVTIPIFGSVKNNTTFTNDYVNVIDFDKDNLQVTETRGGKNGTYFLSKSEVFSWDTEKNQITFNQTEQKQIGSKIEVQEVPINTDNFTIPAGKEKDLVVIVKPKIGLRSDGTWGYSINYNPWYNTSFNKRINITFNNSGIIENLARFTVLVVLNSTRIDYSLTNDNGSDLRFTDSDESTILAHEIELWNESGNSYVWVNVPQINSDSTTDFIQLYYNNNSQISDGQNVTGTWGTNYTGVWHLPNTGNLLDSSPFRNDASGTGDVNRTGQVDGGVSANTTKTVTNSNTLNSTSSFTASFWINTNAALNSTYGPAFINKESWPDTGWNIADNGQWNDGDTIQFRILPGGNSGSCGTGMACFSRKRINDTNWHHIVGVYTSSSTNMKFYYDKNLADSRSSGTFTQNANDIGIVGLAAPVNQNGSIVDEVRISNVSRSHYWINATYKSESDTFNTYGAEESPAPIIIGSREPRNATYSGYNNTVYLDNFIFLNQSNIDKIVYNINNETNNTILPLVIINQSSTLIDLTQYNQSLNTSGINCNSQVCTYNQTAFINVSNSTSLNSISKKFSVHLNNVTFTSTGGYSRLFERIGGFGALFNFDGTNIVFEMTDNNSNLWQLTSTQTFTSGVPYNLSFDYDGAAMRIFVNGTLDSHRELLALTINNTPNVNLFVGGATASYHFDGTMGQFSLYNDSSVLKTHIGLLNPSFEQRPYDTDEVGNSEYLAAHWRNENISGTPSFYVMNTSDSRTGNASIRASHTLASDRSYIAQNPNRYKPDVVAGNWYNLSAYYKSTINGGSGVRLQLIWWYNNWTSIHANASSYDASNYTDWHYISVNATAPAGAVKGDWVLEFLGSGNVTWDDVAYSTSDTLKGLVNGSNYVNHFVNDSNANSGASITYFTLNATEPAHFTGDTCTYYSGNWNVLCSQNCVVASNVDVGGNNITITGTGTFKTTANITNWKNLLIQGTSASNICYVKADGGGGFKE
ncbi:DUF2341 domain-containing protein [Candidatus Pacearchaeota archaeon]|nr:DUF2341 domain-containing protein [Candidatus Pacearchaeota archaeon]